MGHCPLAMARSPWICVMCLGLRAMGHCMSRPVHVVLGEGCPCAGASRSFAERLDVEPIALEGKRFSYVSKRKLHMFLLRFCGCGVYCPTSVTKSKKTSSAHRLKHFMTCHTCALAWDSCTWGNEHATYQAAPNVLLAVRACTGQECVLRSLWHLPFFHYR